MVHGARACASEIRMFPTSISRDVCVSLTHLEVLYVQYMLIRYCHEHEKIRGRVSEGQVHGSLSDQPKVWYDMRLDVFLINISRCVRLVDPFRSFLRAVYAD